MPIYDMKWQGCLQEEILAYELCAVIEQVFAKSKKKAVATGMGVLPGPLDRWALHQCTCVCSY
jgi:hypothetical protein